MWSPRTSPIVVGAGLLVAFVSVPLIALSANLPWSRIGPVLATEQTIQAVITSLVSTTVSTALIAVLGVPLGYLLATRSFPGRGIITWLVYFPLVLPPLVAGLLLLLVWGQSGTVEQFLQPRGVLFVNQLSGIILCQMFVSSPFVVVASRSAFERLDPELEEAARSMGADTLTIFWSIAFPLSIRAVMAGVTLSWMRSFGEFGATAIVAYHPFSFPTFVWNQFGTVPFSESLPLVLLAVILGASALLIAAGLERAGALSAARRRHRAGNSARVSRA